VQMRGVWLLCALLGNFLLLAHCREKFEKHDGPHDGVGREDAPEDGAEMDQFTDSENPEGPEEEGSTEGEDGVDENALEEEKDKIFAEELTSAQLSGLHDKIDSDKDGKITHGEVMAFSKASRQQIVGKEIGEMFEEMDADKDGKIS